MKALLFLLLAAPASADYLSAPVEVTKSTPITVLQGSNPWVVTATTITFQFTSTQAVNVVNLDTTTVTLFRQGELIGNSSFTVYQGSAPWTMVFPTTQPVFALQTSSYAVNSSSFDIRALNSGRDSVSAYVQTAQGSLLSVVAGATLPVSVSSLPLPPGAATEATLLTLFKQGQYIGNSTFTVTQGSAPWDVSGSTVFIQVPLPLPVDIRLSSITVLQGTSPWNVSGSTVSVMGLSASTLTVQFASTQPISVASLPLPDGAATEATLGTRFAAGQLIGNTSFFALPQGTYSVASSSLDIRGLVSGRDSVLAVLGSSVPVVQGQNPWRIEGGTVGAVQNGQWSVSITSGNVSTTVNIASVAVFGVAGSSLAVYFPAGTVLPVVAASSYVVTGSTVHVVNAGSGILRVGLFENDGSSITASAVGSGNGLDMNLAGVGGVTFKIGQSTMAGSIPVTMAVNQATFPVNAVPMRPSSFPGRVYISTASSLLTGNQIFYTVTSGKTLFVTSMVLSGQNTSSTIPGDLQVKDNLVQKINLLIPQTVSGVLTGIVQGASIFPTFQEPVPFTTNIRVNIANGAVTYSFSFNGYEE